MRPSLMRMTMRLCSFSNRIKMKMMSFAKMLKIKMARFANKMKMKMVSFANKQHIKNSHGVQWLLIANTHSTSVYIVLSVVFIFIIFWSTITIILLLTGQQYFQSYLFSNTMFANIILLSPFWKWISNFKKKLRLHLTVLLSQWPSLGFLFSGGHDRCYVFDHPFSCSFQSSFEYFVSVTDLLYKRIHYLVDSNDW